MTDQMQLLIDADVPEHEESREGIDDIGAVSPRTVSQAVVSATDWTTETILSQINKGNIQLNPRFQRRDAWDADRKSKFIESLLLGFPVPQIVLAESKERKGSYIVIDGKQRLLSLRQFAADESDPHFRRLKLTGVKVRPDLAKKSLADLRSDPTLDNDLAEFENRTIRTVVVRNWSSENFLYEVFLRLNTGSVPLSPQELRQALHPGPFVNYADEASGESAALRDLLKLKRPDFRMRDVELFIRYLSFALFLDTYTGDLKLFLDATCKKLNEQWNVRGDEVKQLAVEFEEAYVLACRVFGHQNVFRKWIGDRYERPLNRAIFDVVMYFFRFPDVRARVAGLDAVVADAFKKLCSESPEFLSAIERTTKSLGATSTRLQAWGEALEGALGIDLPVPALVGPGIA